MNDIMRVIKERRSIRAFQERQIPLEDCKAIIEAGLYAPSGRNTQPWHFTVVRKKNTIDAITRELKAATARMPENIYKSLVGSDTYTVSYGAPTFILVGLSNASRTPEADCAVALENMFLMACSLGIGSCWINQLRLVTHEPGFRQLLTELGVPKEYAISGCAAFGYPIEGFPTPSPRRGSVSWIEE